MTHGKCPCLVSNSKTRLDSTDSKMPMALLESQLPLRRSEGNKYSYHTARVVWAVRVGLCQAISTSTGVQYLAGLLLVPLLAVALTCTRPCRLALGALPSRLLCVLPSGCG